MSNLKDRFKTLSEHNAKISKADDREQEHQWYGSSVDTKINLGLWTILPVNFYTMYIGIQAESQRWTTLQDVNSIQAVMITGTIALLMWISWYGVYSFVPRCRTNWATFAIAMFSVCFLVWSIIMSSLASFLGITNAITRPGYMHETLVEAADRITLIMDASRNAKAVLPRLQALEEQACSDADNEIQTGGLTRLGSGFGVGAATYKSVCSGVGSVRRLLDKNIKQTQIKADDINQNLERLFTIVDDRNIPILKREDAFRKGMAQLSRLQREYRSQGLEKVVFNSAGILRNIVPAVEVNSGLRPQVINVITGMRKKLQAEAHDLEKIVGRKDGIALKPISYRDTLVPISFRFIGDLFHYLVMATFLDIFPFIMLWFRAIYSVRPKENQENFPSFEDRIKLNSQIPVSFFEKKEAQTEKEIIQ